MGLWSARTARLNRCGGVAFTWRRVPGTAIGLGSVTTVGADTVTSNSAGDSDLNGEREGCVGDGTGFAGGCVGLAMPLLGRGGCTAG